MNDQVSAYHINYVGVLCYSGLPTNDSGLTFEHHNGRPWRNLPNNTSYEVGGVAQYGLWHGRPFRTFPIKFLNR